MKKLLLALTISALSLTALSPLSHAAEGKLTRVHGTGRIETSIAASKATFPSAKVAIIASDRGYADALSGGPLALQVNGPILLSSTSVKDAVAREIKRLGVEKVLILGGNVAVSENVEKELKKNYTVERIAGKNRYETGKKISEYQNKLDGKTRTRIGYATGTNYADALVAGPFINKEGSLLLHDPVLNLINPEIVFGGPNALPKVQNAKLRIYGQNRYETAVKIANSYKAGAPYAPGQTVVIASGMNYPDALSAGSLVNAYRSVLLLTEKGVLPKSTKEYISKANIKNIIIIGGEAAITKSLQNEIVKLKNIDPKNIFEITEKYTGPVTKEELPVVKEEVTEESKDKTENVVSETETIETK